ncbi:HepT-like ribonuclease domain-containing protein [Dyadobacter sp. 676]|uniref:HepT-like ribonuclease domain-containing protein n=1 Tax=Dyadobacter sp. 676 TaxID=3088362 RepID=A0AAU8FVY3_9BACT
MSPLLIDFLRHIESELRNIEDKTANLDYDRFVSDETLSKAVVRSFEIIGEACKRIPDEI